MDDDDIFMGINLDALETAATVQSGSSNYSKASTVAIQQPQITRNVPKRDVSFPDDIDMDELEFLNSIENEIKREHNVQENIDCIPPSPPSSNESSRKRPMPSSTSKFSSNQLQPPSKTFQRQSSYEQNVNSTNTITTNGRYVKNLDVIDYSNLFDSIDDFNDDDVFELPKNTDQYTILDAGYKYKINNCNLATLNQLEKYSRGDKCNIDFIVLAEALDVTQKFQIKADRFLLQVMLGDFSHNTKLEVLNSVYFF